MSEITVETTGGPEAKAAGQKKEPSGSTILGKLFWHVLSWVLVALALFLLRLELTNIMALSFADAWQARMGLGILRDVAALSGLATIVWALYVLMGLRQCFLWSIGTWVLFFSALANVCYFRIFGCPLELWAIFEHYPEALDYFPNFRDLQVSPLVTIAMAVLLASTVVSFIASYGQLARSGFYLTKILPSVGLMLLFAVIWFAGRKVPAHFSEQGETILTEETVTTWYDQLLKGFGKKLDDSGEKVAAFGRELREQPPGGTLSAIPVETSVKFAPAMRQLLGLPPTGPVNVLLLIVNNWRSFELLQTDTANMVMPRTGAILATKSINFTQAYSSAVGVGHHEQAVLSTLCSRMPNNVGPAAIVVSSAYPVECLQHLLRQHGYTTAWLGGFASGHHGLHAFELLQGSDYIYDRDYFEQQGIKTDFGSHYLADGPFLQKGLQLLEELAQKERPFFAQITTGSATYPYNYVADGGELNPLILERGAAFPEYLGYLSRLHYDDREVAAFIEALFASPLGDNTVVFLVGNHGSVVVPYHQLNNNQLVELSARIPLAVISKNIVTPQKVTSPVHQLDVAPTIAHLLGVAPSAKWQGQGLLSGRSAPWMQLKGGLPSFRFGERACYTSERDRRPHCFSLAGQDPLLSGTLPASDLDTEMLQKVQTFFVANGQLIGENRLEK